MQPRRRNYCVPVIARHGALARNFAWTDEQVVDLSDGLVGIIQNVASDDLGSAIAGRQSLYIDLADVYRL